MSMLILASSSPRRRELLQQIGADFTVCPGTYDEDVPGRDNPEKFVHTQAVGKAASVAALYPHAWVVGADTIVAANGKILGKPRSEAERYKCCGTFPARVMTYIRVLLCSAVKAYTAM